MQLQALQILKNDNEVENWSLSSFLLAVNADLFSELVEGNGDDNVLFVPNEYADTENDYANEIGEDSLNDQAKEDAFEDYYDQLLTNVVWKKPIFN